MENSQVCAVCGHENPATASLCQSCQMVLSINTIPITIGETPLPASRGEARPIRNSVFLHVEGSPAPLEIRLHDGVRVVMGRHDPENQSKYLIDLGAFDAAEKGVSRQHATLSYENGTLTLADLNSLNATHLNGNPIAPHEPRDVNDGDVIMLGKLAMTVHFE